MLKPDPTSILIVEDELIVAESLSLDLQRKGYAIAGIVSSGEEAIDAMTLMQPDLILMDIMLKGFLDGIETSKAIQHRQSIPIVYITAFSDAATLERVKQTGEPLYYLVKPIRLKDLIKTIEAALDSSDLPKRAMPSVPSAASTSSAPAASSALQTAEAPSSVSLPPASAQDRIRYDEIDLSFFDTDF